MARARRRFTLLTTVLASLTFLTVVPPAVAADPPTVRVFAASTDVTTERGRGAFVFVDPGIWVASVGGAFELRATRPDYDTSPGLVQTDATTGAVLRTLPAELLEGWSGLSNFFHVRVRDVDGNVVFRQDLSFCPNSYYRARLSDDGPLNSVYPYICGGNPFTRGAVWGIDDQWAVSALSDFGIGFVAERRNYEMRVRIDPAWVEALAIAPENAEANVNIHAVPRGTLAGASAPGRTAPYERAPRVPTVTNPDPQSLPDLIALPAWGVSTYHRKGRDFLAFNATEWNAGPGTLVVEGFRSMNQEFMDAFQYFFVDGAPTGRAPIGQLEFHREHYHWHFEEFTEYTFLDAASGQVAVSGKQSWCLANTDAIDLSVQNANWAAFSGDLFTMCGGPGALWIREVLDVGWGDTYAQFSPDQAFDITDLPNGDYYIRTTVNPTGSLFETNPDNNVEDRLVQLRGRPGARRVIVPPWHGIDTENYCYYCGR
jgi:lysyl oxidase